MATIHLGQTVRGRLKWFNRVKGYGFITSPDVPGDIYMHNTTLKRDGVVALPSECVIAAVVACDEGRWRVLRVLDVRAAA